MSTRNADDAVDAPTGFLWALCDSDPMLEPFWTGGMMVDGVFVVYTVGLDLEVADGVRPYCAERLYPLPSVCNTEFSTREAAMQACEWHGQTGRWDGAAGDEEEAAVALEALAGRALTWESSHHQDRGSVHGRNNVLADYLIVKEVFQGTVPDGMPCPRYQFRILYSGLILRRPPGYPGVYTSRADAKAACERHHRTGRWEESRG